jgi:hypothetical protein
MSNHTSPILIGILVLLFPAFWCFISWNISRASGWQQLAKAYPAGTPPKGAKFKVNGLIGNQKYSGNLLVHVSEDGFFLSATLPVSFGHEPLFIPWSAVQNRRPKDSRWRATVEFEVGSPCITRMELPRNIFHNWYRS